MITFIIISVVALLLVFIAAVIYLAVLDVKDETDDLKRAPGKTTKP